MNEMDHQQKELLSNVRKETELLEEQRKLLTLQLQKVKPKLVKCLQKIVKNQSFFQEKEKMKALEVKLSVFKKTFPNV